MTPFSLAEAPWRRRLIVLSLPILALLLGEWQLQRGRFGVTCLLQEMAQLAAQTHVGDLIAQGTPNRILGHAGSSLLQWKVFTQQIRVWLAYATMLGGTTSFIGGVAGFIAAKWAAQRSREPRDALEMAFARIRIIMPIILGTFAGGFAFACIAAGSFELAGWLIEALDGRTKIIILSPSFAVASMLLWLAWITVHQLRRSFAAFSPAPMLLLGLEVTPDKAPGLWRFIAERASDQSVAMPDHVAAGLVEGFFVTTASLALKPGNTLLRGHTLHISLPMLAMLNMSETTAIIGHELAHSASQSGYSTQFVTIYSGIARNLETFRAMPGIPTAIWIHGPVVTLGTHMLAVFDEAVKHWSRLREIEADRAGAQHVGQEAAACALLRTAVLQPTIGTVLSETWRTPGIHGLDLVAAIVARAEATCLSAFAATL